MADSARFKVIREAIMADRKRFAAICEAIREDIERRFAANVLRAGPGTGSLARFLCPIFPLAPLPRPSAEQELRFRAMRYGVAIRPGLLLETGPSAAASAPPARPRGPLVFCQSQWDPDD